MTTGPPKKLSRRTGEDLLTYRRIRALTLFGDLPPRMEGRLRGQGGQGAVVIRHYRKGDVVCRQGEPGWTAFYLLKVEDMLMVRQAHQSMANAADEALAKRAPDKLARTRRERRKLAEELEKTGADAELADLLFASAGRPEEGEIEALVEEQATLAAGDRADAELARHHVALTRLDAGAKRRLADEMGPSDPELASLLIASVVAAEQRRRVVVSVARPAPAKAATAGRFASLLRMLRGGSSGGSADAPVSRPRASQAPASASGESEEVATLVEGELFGELSCIYHAPRSATVQAVRDFYAIELLGNVLEMLLASDSFRRELDENYRKRLLGRELAATPLFEGVPAGAITLLQARAGLLKLRPGEVLYEQGAPADGVYLVRSGTVKLFRSEAEGRPFAHRSRGEMLGELEFLDDLPRGATCIGYGHPRVPSRHGKREPMALPIELVHLPKALLEDAAARFPGFRESLARKAVADEPALASTAVGTSRFDDLGLSQGRSLLLVDREKCTGCNDCVQACADVQSDGFPRLALEGPRFGNYLIASSCRKCDDAVCLIGCPVRSIHKGAAGEIVIESWCIGCGLCAQQCPYQAIDMRALPAPKPPAQVASTPAPDAPLVESIRRAVTCDQCASVPGGPRCVAACAHDAAMRVDAPDFFARAKVR